MIQVYGIKNCDSVKKALSFFKNHKLEYELHDFKTDKVSSEKISSWLRHVPIKTLFNSRSTTYRELKLKELALEDEAKAQWLAKENMLIKRPVIEFDDTLVVGFNEENYKGLFL
ncbi:arsenate reductase family protein [bacterium]|nr:arsenate reductase family protein [bacterium]MBU1989151.1 arsenate reductase family protein [bacterium]